MDDSVLTELKKISVIDEEGKARQVRVTFARNFQLENINFDIVRHCFINVSPAEICNDIFTYEISVITRTEEEMNQILEQSMGKFLCLRIDRNPVWQHFLHSKMFVQVAE